MIIYFSTSIINFVCRFYPATSLRSLRQTLNEQNLYLHNPVGNFVWKKYENWIKQTKTKKWALGGRTRRSGSFSKLRASIRRSSAKLMQKLVTRGGTGEHYASPSAAGSCGGPSSSMALAIGIPGGGGAGHSLLYPVNNSTGSIITSR